ncbi:unnamed protein product, partial [Mesorhabditis spiculigera]
MTRTSTREAAKRSAQKTNAMLEGGTPPKTPKRDESRTPRKSLTRSAQKQQQAPAEKTPKKPAARRLDFGDADSPQEDERSARLSARKQPASSTARPVGRPRKETGTPARKRLEFDDENLEQSDDDDDENFDPQLKATTSKPRGRPRKAMNTVGAHDGQATPSKILADQINRISLGNIDKSPELDDQFLDEFDQIQLSRADRYFQRGRGTGARGRGRRGRGGKTNRREGGRIAKTSDAMEEDAEPLDDLASLEVLDLAAIKDYMASFSYENPPLPKSRLEKNRKDAEALFTQWQLYSNFGFNFLVHGVGSKKCLLEEFQERFLQGEDTFMIDGYLPTVTMKGILGAINESLKLKIAPKRKMNTSDWARSVGRVIRKRKEHVYLLLNSLDGPHIRNDIAILANLVSAAPEHLHLIATVDHLNSMLLFDTCTLGAFRFLFCAHSNMRLPAEEILASEIRILGMSAKNAKIQHTVASLDVIWTSCPENSRKIFRLFFALYFAQNASVSFWDLFDQARDRFYVSTDVALRQQIVEFEDHNIVRIRRSEDGNEKLTAAVDRELIERFLQEKGLTLNADDDDDD